MDKVDDLWEAFRELFDAAQRFEQRAPRYQKLHADREELREALTNAGLILSLSEERPESARKRKRKQDGKDVA